MRQIRDHSIWIGNAGDLRDVRRILDAGIEAIVELADSEPMADLPRDRIRCRFPLSDGGENPAWLIRLATDTVAAFLTNNVAAIICCSAGLSRSVCIAAGGLAIAEQRSLSESLSIIVGEGPADVSPRFLDQVRQSLEA